jgi:hypothetical protein
MIREDMKAELDYDFDAPAALPVEITQEDITAVVKSLRELAPSLDTYSNLEGLHVKKRALEVLNAITPDKIAGASLRDLVTAYKLLKEKDQLIQGKPTELTGIMHLVVTMEKKYQQRSESATPGVAGEQRGFTSSEAPSEAGAPRPVDSKTGNEVAGGFATAGRVSAIADAPQDGSAVEEVPNL